MSRCHLHLSQFLLTAKYSGLCLQPFLGYLTTLNQLHSTQLYTASDVRGLSLDVFLSCLAILCQLHLSKVYLIKYVVAFFLSIFKLFNDPPPTVVRITLHHFAHSWFLPTFIPKFLTISHQMHPTHVNLAQIFFCRGEGLSLSY
jgi:cellulose synthase/poly-beta-1,6-N-acetylglucosamine synthase-like glycosyltransferase